ncbi:hypothetical protein C0Q70_16309 [Pomacea canaliculata]|uniref:Leucine-rich repeat-containing protein 40 n=1 Tax=Pomacea canaliculata TaxID=400727 RepID=A0A2T7NPF0_POMCA|nr:hypothetical protein C0Q70_16309 [Pomacea canaliculata]
MASRGKGVPRGGAKFGIQKPLENSNKIHDSILKQARQSGQLNLSGRNLTEVPENVWRINTDIPEETRSVSLDNTEERWWEQTELTKLILASNMLKGLGEGLSQLSALTVLDVHDNQLTLLPDALGTLENLQKLNVSRNQLQELPACLGYLHSLVSLHVEQNKLQQLCPEIAHLTKLEELSCLCTQELHLGNNSIMGISPEHLQHLTSITFLDLRDNKIAKLPDEISLLQGLERLDLSNNDLSALPYSLGTISSLKSVVLDGNPLRSIRRDIIMRGTVELKKYLKSRIEEHEVPSSTRSSARESILPMASGDSALSHEMQQSKILDFSNQKANDVPSDMWDKAKQAAVTVVNLSKNQLTELPSNLTVLKASVTELNLGFNKIASLKPDIGLFLKLVFLDLRYGIGIIWPSTPSHESFYLLSLFTEIPPVLYPLKKLEILFLNDNKINDIDAVGLQQMPVLATLDLQNNNISQVPPELGKCASLRSLQISGNPFRNPRPAILAKGTQALLEYLRSRIVN